MSLARTFLSTRGALAALFLVLSGFGMARDARAQTVVYVNAAATGANSGASWSNAYTSLSTALNNHTNAEIWVARGTYKPGTTTASFFNLRTHILRGGFAGDETNATRSVQAIAANPTVLSGDLVGSNTVSVMKKSVAGAAVLDGLFIQNGFSTGANDGAGLNLSAGSLTVTDCTFATNRAGRAGGAIYVGASVTGLAITRGTFVGNQADGAVSVSQYGQLSGGDITFHSMSGSATLTDCTFTGSRTAAVLAVFAAQPGGGGSIGASFKPQTGLTITGSKFTDCTALNARAGALMWIMNGTNSALTIRGTTFSNCVAKLSGAINAVDSTVATARGNTILIEDSQFFSNRSTDTDAAGGGGAMMTQPSSYTLKSVVINRCRFIGNTSTGTGGALLLVINSGGICRIFNSVFGANHAAKGGGAITDQFQFDNPDKIWNCTFVDNTSEDGKGGAVFRPGVAFFTTYLRADGCIFRGNRLTPAGTTFYMEGSGGFIANNSFVDDASAPGVNQSFADPELVSVAFKDYRLASDSPAIDTLATYDWEASGTLDVAGVPRPQDIPVTGANGTTSEYDFGAHEMQVADFVPVIVVRGNGLLIPTNNIPSPANLTDFGASAVGGFEREHTFSIYGLSASPLKLGQGVLHDQNDVVTIAGDAAFSLVSQPVAQEVPAGDPSARTFTIRFSPTVVGSFSAVLWVHSNDPNIPVYVINVSGVALSIPDPAIEVRGGAFWPLIPGNGLNTPSTVDNTEFGLVGLGDENAKTLSYRVLNRADATAVLNIERVSLGGADAANFSLVTNATDWVLDPGETTTFGVTFRPQLSGRKNATVTVVSDDPDATNYVFNIAGDGQQILYVDDTATGNNDGSSFVNAFTNLVQALAVAGDSAELWIAQGVYRPGTNAAAFFNLRNQTLRGGFSGTETGAVRPVANIPANPTILSGDLGNGLRAANVIRKSVVGSAVLEGVIVQGGFSTGASDGAGLLLNDGSLALNYSTFSSNTAGRAGGALYVAQAADGLTVTRCAFSNNVANGFTVGNLILSGYNNYEADGLAGGDICLFNTAFNVVLSESTFTGSRSTKMGPPNAYTEYGGGGSVAASVRSPDGGECSLTIDRCVFDSSQSTGSYGGAIFWKTDQVIPRTFLNVGRLNILKSTFVRCSARLGGGAVIFGNQSNSARMAHVHATIEDSRFERNSARGKIELQPGVFWDTGTGGAIQNFTQTAHAQTIAIRRCTFLLNEAVLTGGALQNLPPQHNNQSYAYTCIIANSEFSGNTNAASTGNGGAIYASGGAIVAEGGLAAINNCTFVDNRCGSAGRGGVLYVSLNTLRVLGMNGCIFRGNQGGTRIVHQARSSGAPMSIRDSFMEGTGTPYFTDPSVFESTIVTNINPQLSDPNLTDVVGPEYDLRLLPRSPAIDFHVNYNVAASGTRDVTGRSRPFDVPQFGVNGTGTEYDAGANEYEGAPRGLFLMVR